MTEQKTVNATINIADGEAFFCHEMSINFNPLQFTFDFKSITPRIDSRNQDGTAIFAMKHNVVMLEPWHAKEVLKALSDSVKKYEQQFGSIEKPKALLIAEKSMKGINIKNAPQSYFG